MSYMKTELLKSMYTLPGIGRMEERRDKHSHGKEELTTQEKWCDRQTKRNKKRLNTHSKHSYQLSTLRVEIETYISAASACSVKS